MFEIVLPLEARSLSGHQLRVAHSSTGVGRGLELDEYVVLRDADDDRRFLGRVVGLAFDLDDTFYEVRVDGMLAATVADRYTRVDAVDTNEVALLLRHLAPEHVPV